VLMSRRTGAEIVGATSDLRQAVLDGIDGHQDFVLLGATETAIARTAPPAARLSGARHRLGLIAASAGGLVQVLAGSALVSVLAIGLGTLETGAIDGPLLAGLLLAVLASFEASAMLVRSATRLAGAAAAAERLHAIATATPAVLEPVSPQPLPPGGEVRFEAVRFGYDPERPVIGPLDLTIHSGECVAIAGPSGAGKSTIAHLLVRLADANAGIVRVAGRDVRDVASETLRRRVVLMTQDAPVFLDTVRANLLIGHHDASDVECWQALEAVRLGDFVRGLPHGLDTVVGEAGRTLSAGQARRVGLARTLLSDAAVVVLDEPTSGLDHEAEAMFLAELPELLRGRTAIVITHAGVPTAFDRVYAMQAGRLAEAPRGAL
jgi:ATP-binding cassette subfamily C protein CydC